MRPHSYAFILLIFLLGSHATLAQKSTGSIAGKVIDQGSQQVLDMVNVRLEGHNQGTQTDSTGQFRLLGIPVGTYNLVLSAVGYQTQKIYNLVITSGNESFYVVELQPSNTSLQEVVVRENRKTVRAASLETPLSVQKLSTEEIKSNPGGNFDISKVIQVLPGVGGGVAGGGFRNDIIIRGGGPNENVFYLDGIEIPVLNHFQTQGSSGGPQGILNVSFIEDVKLSSSAFDARYDNALSSVFQFRQKVGNPEQFQGNLRLSATELALTTEGPIGQSGKTSFLASARRSYLQFLFQALDIPIRPNFWDFQFKINHQINEKTSWSLLGLGAIDEFSFAGVKEASPEKLYIYNSNPIINQWNYTLGFSLKKLLDHGYSNLAISRNAFNNNIKKYEDNQKKDPNEINLDLESLEIENKVRWDVNLRNQGWKISYGAMAQWIEYENQTRALIRKQLISAMGQVIQPELRNQFSSPLPNILKMGAFFQASKTFMDNRLGLSLGLRSDVNSFSTQGMNPLKTLSPRFSLSYVLSDAWTWNASLGRYFKLAPYTILGFADNQGNLVNKNAGYQSSNHFVTGLEYLPSESLRFTLEAFHKQYQRVPISIRNGISLANLGGDFNVLGNEAVLPTGLGQAYGLEFFAQKKLTDKFFGAFSYTYYHSKYTGLDGKYRPSAWDNRHLLSVTWGYKFPKNWELGLKFRYQGGAPYTPYDLEASRLNFLSKGQGIFDFSRLNTLRLRNFHSSDVRIDKKWNFKGLTLDVFMDVTNWYVAAAEGIPNFSFKRLADNSGFETFNRQPLKPDGSNAIPVSILNDDASTTPTIGFILEF